MFDFFLFFSALSSRSIRDHLTIRREVGKKTIGAWPIEIFPFNYGQVNGAPHTIDLRWYTCRCAADAAAVEHWMSISYYIYRKSYVQIGELWHIYAKIEMNENISVDKKKKTTLKNISCATTNVNESVVRLVFIAMWVFIDDWFLSSQFNFTLASHCGVSSVFSFLAQRKHTHTATTPIISI